MASSGVARTSSLLEADRRAVSIASLRVIDCAGCHVKLQYPITSYSVQCPVCAVTTAVRTMATVACVGCRQTLMCVTVGSTECCRFA